MMADAEGDPADALESLLHWYVAMGVDAAVGETACDRFVAPASPSPPAAQGSREAKAPERPAALPDAGVAQASADTLVAAARASAAAAGDFAALRRGFETLRGCGLAATARLIFAGGTPGAPLMLLGAAPESDDERQGEAFSGAGGRLLDAMLAAIGLDRSQVYMSYVVPWRPPGNRPPTPLELDLCLPLTRRHIALAAPRAILCFGERAAQPLLGTRDTISRLRGRWFAYEGETTTVKLLATFSPAYLLGQPLQKRRAWADLQTLATALAPEPDTPGREAGGPQP